MYKEAMQLVETEAEAEAWLDSKILEWMRDEPELDRVEARETLRRNVAYFAGYYSHETRARVERLFKTEHPFFGSIAEKGPPTIEEAFSLGMELGKSAQKCRLDAVSADINKERAKWNR